jgi:NADH dehydrogenase
MKKIIVIGGGFAGLAALGRLAARGIKAEVLLLDKKETSDFLPCLPDVIGLRLRPDYLSVGLKALAQGCGADFAREEVLRLDLDGRKVFTAAAAYSYDYLVISAGSETNFYGNPEFSRRAKRLDSAQDAREIAAALAKGGFAAVAIIGGGYTGVEVSANVSRSLARRKLRARVMLVERAPEILGALPQWIKDYCLRCLRDLRVEIITSAAVEKIEGGSLAFGSGQAIDGALVIWAAGVKTPQFIQGLKEEKNPQGRLQVDSCLRVRENCYACGDAALFSSGDSALRMAVQFALAQGQCCADNIIRQERGMRLRQYRPQDLGYIIPLAGKRACGIALGRKVRGGWAARLHYAMCLLRLPGLGNKSAMAVDLLRGGWRW